jgi:hypothetical protein
MCGVRLHETMCMSSANPTEEVTMIAAANGDKSKDESSRAHRPSREVQYRLRCKSVARSAHLNFQENVHLC